VDRPLQAPSDQRFRGTKDIARIGRVLHPAITPGERALLPPTAHVALEYLGEGVSILGSWRT
jgi:hypothetical protein